MTSTVQLPPKATVFGRTTLITAMALGYLAATVAAEWLSQRYYVIGLVLIIALNTGVTIVLGRWWKNRQQQLERPTSWRKAGLSVFVAYCLLRTAMGLLMTLVIWP